MSSRPPGETGIVKPVPALLGSLRLPADKSVAHRALLFSAMGNGTAEITLDRPGEDVLSMAGALRALGRADQVIEDTAAYVAREPETLLLVAADSDAAGLQLVSPPPVQKDGRVTGINGNPADAEIDRQLFPVDGVEGRATVPFRPSWSSTRTVV